MATPYGQFGTPGFFQRDIPTDVVQSYPGTQNIKQAGQMYGNLLYGPLSKGYGVAGAQATDPSAQAFQQETLSGGGAFGVPGAGSTALGSLFGGSMAGDVAGQHAQQQQQQKAAQGMYDVANTYAQDIYGTQSAQNTLERAKAEQQAAQEQGIMSLINMFTSPTGMGANILGPGGAGVLGAGQSPFGKLWQAGAGMFGGGAAGAGGLTGGLDITDFTSMLGSFGGAGGAAAGSGAALSDIATMAPDLLAFAG